MQRKMTRRMANKARMDLAFLGWWDWRGRGFAITPEPNEAVRQAIAAHAFRAGWLARHSRTIRQQVSEARYKHIKKAQESR